MESLSSIEDADGQTLRNKEFLKGADLSYISSYRRPPPPRIRPEHDDIECMQIDVDSYQVEPPSTYFYWFGLGYIKTD